MASFELAHRTHVLEHSFGDVDVDVEVEVSIGADTEREYVPQHVIARVGFEVAVRSITFRPRTIAALTEDVVLLFLNGDS